MLEREALATHQDPAVLLQKNLEQFRQKLLDAAFYGENFCILGQV
jgi:hypothetical protein